MLRERDLKKIDEKEIEGAKLIYYVVEVGDGEIELIVRLHPPTNFDQDLLKLFLISEIFPYEILKIYEMGEMAPKIIQFSKKTSHELLELEKSKIENKIKKAIDSMNHPKKKVLLKAAKRKLDELKKEPEKNKREIDLLVMKINELLFYI